ncbi:MAG: hypothetical protein ACK529_07555 [Alphaproteobacteria bacterium]|jgi:hypothetical protein
MADSSGSSGVPDFIAEGQSQKEVTANGYFDASSPSILFGRRASTTGLLTWGFYGGEMLVDGVLTAIGNSSFALTASATNFVEATRAGSVSGNTTGFTAGRIPLYEVVTNATTVTSYTDRRAWVQPLHVAGLLSRSMTADANITLTAAEARNQVLRFTSTVSLTTTRDVIVPLAPQIWTVSNETNGAQSLRFIGLSGTGITVANARRAIIFSDGTNIVRATADQA